MKIEELKSKLTQTPFKVWFAVSFETEPDTFSYLIEKFQGTRYTHALAIYYSLDTCSYVIANARGQASQLDTIEQFHEIDQVQHLFEKDISSEERLSFCQEVVRLDGIDYSEMQIVDIGIDRIFGVKMRSNGIEGIICSEYVDRLAQSVGLPSTSKVVGKSVELISPQDNVKAWRKFCSQMVTFRELK